MYKCKKKLKCTDVYGLCKGYKLDINWIAVRGRHFDRRLIIYKTMGNNKKNDGKAGNKGKLVTHENNTSGQTTQQPV